jgi:hypothetical protein
MASYWSLVGIDLLRVHIHRFPDQISFATLSSSSARPHQAGLGQEALLTLLETVSDLKNRLMEATGRGKSAMGSRTGQERKAEIHLTVQFKGSQLEPARSRRYRSKSYAVSRSNRGPALLQTERHQVG